MSPYKEVDTPNDLPSTSVDPLLHNDTNLTVTVCKEMRKRPSMGSVRSGRCSILCVNNKASVRCGQDQANQCTSQQ